MSCRYSPLTTGRGRQPLSRQGGGRRIYWSSLLRKWLGLSVCSALSVIANRTLDFDRTIFSFGVITPPLHPIRDRVWENLQAGILLFINMHIYRTVRKIVSPSFDRNFPKNVCVIAERKRDVTPYLHEYAREFRVFAPADFPHQKYGDFILPLAVYAISRDSNEFAIIVIESRLA